MRKFEFRAYDEINKNFRYGIMPDGHFWKNVLLDGITLVDQFSGMYDIKGNKIYENDIVERRALNKPGDIAKYGIQFLIQPRTHIVKYSDYSFYPISLFEDAFDMRWEVVGNIYENPELLKTNN